jgi:hypothetical protein
MDVTLEIAAIFGTAFVEKPIQEMTAKRTKTLGGDCVAASIVTMIWRFAGLDSVVWVCKEDND